MMSNLKTQLIRRLFPIGQTLGIIPRRAVIPMEGDICSQMRLFLIGDELKRQGETVAFDSSAYREPYTNCEGLPRRNFNLLSAFTDLKPLSHMFDFTPAERFINSLYREALPPRRFKLSEDAYTRSFKQFFKVDYSQIEGANRRVLDNMAFHRERTVAIHVSRRDSAKSSDPREYLISDDYFIEAALAQVRDIGEPRFYLFSDEPAWCRSHLMPLLKKELPKECSIELVDNNGSERDWLDLFLMSQCCGIIAGKGLAGKYAALLRGKDWDDGLIVLCSLDDTNMWEGILPRTYII